MLLHKILAALAAVTITLHLPVHFVIAAEYKLRAEVTVPVDKDNRMLFLEWDGDGGAGRASRQLDEYTDWTRHTFTIVLYPGHYQIRAHLVKAGGKEEVTGTQEVEIVETVPQT